MKLLDQRPRLLAHIRGYPLPEEKAAILLAETGSRAFDEDEIFPHLLPLLDGRRTVQEIVLELNARFPFTEVVGRVNLLQEEGMLTFEAAARPAAEAAFWEGHGVTPTPAAGNSVGVQVLADLDMGGLDAIWARHGLTATTAAAPITLVLVDDYLRPDLEVINRETTRPWLLARPAGLEIWLGPLSVPGASACWACLAQRLRLNRTLERFVARQEPSRPAVPRATMPATVQIGINAAAVQVLRWLAAPEEHPLLNTLLTIDALTFERQGHAVTRRPQCPVCGDPAGAAPAPIGLQSRPKSAFHDGGHRFVLPEQTMARYQHHISPLTGLVPALRPLPDDGVIHVTHAGNRFRDGAGTWREVRAGLKNAAAGKGVTAQQAQVSGLAEALERYSAQYEGAEAVQVARYADLGEQALHPYACMNFSEGQYAARRELNASSHSPRTTFIPQPFDESQPLAWAPVWSLAAERWKYAPAAFCYFNYPQEPGKIFCVSESNGNAAGTSLEDAILQGFFELVERDSVALWWYNRLPRPGVRLEGVDDDYIGAVREQYAAMGREFWLLDLTSDLGIPAFVAVSGRSDGRPEGLAAGYGAHLDPAIAALRAITELHQLLPRSLRETEREDRRLAAAGMPTLTNARLADEHYLAPDPEQAAVKVIDMAAPAFDDLRLDIEYCLELLRGKGLEMLVLDMTRPDIGLPVVKVIVPGLRHFWRRLAPGRLYDVPVQMGWQERPLPESELNPIYLHG